MFRKIKNEFLHIFSNRLVVVGTIFGVMALILLIRLFTLQIIKGEDYLDNFKLQIHKSQEIKATRGNILDRNGYVLAYNKLSYSVTIEDNGTFDSLKSSEKNAALNQTILNLLSILDENGDTTVEYFHVALDENGNFVYSVKEGTSRNRFIADVYGAKAFDDLTLSEQNASAEQIVRELCSERYDIDLNATDPKDVLRILNIRYAMSQISYSKYMVTTVAQNISDTTVTMIKENADKLVGVDIAQDSERVYNDPVYFSSIIGYTGIMSADEYEKLSKESEEYALNDIVGKAGIEQSMDLVLRGKKGEKTFYVDSTGTVLETDEETDPVAGGDLYLTIDHELQIAAYKILESELAGIVSKKLINEMTYDAHEASSTYDIKIPIGDVYCALIGNSVIDMTAFPFADAKSVQAQVYKPFTDRQTEAVDALIRQIETRGETYLDMDTTMKSYALYLTKELLTQQLGIIDGSKVDTSDEIYRAWYDDGSVSLRDYLNRCIAMGWLNTSRFEEYLPSGGKYSGKYSESEDIISGLEAYLRYFLPLDDDFSKLVYESMIRDETVTGRQLCLILYEQGVLEWDDEKIAGLNNGSLAPFDFLQNKIRELEITPAQLALEPCTASCVVTDPNNGEVLACVSYPGYDNNKLANTMDTDYYNQLVADKSRPLYNNATQVKCAPGSTYKLVVAAAALESGTMTADEEVFCEGTFRPITPHPKCWIHPSAHGNVNIEGAISHSCNCYFFEVGYRFGQDEFGNYSTNQGIKTLTKYAEDFGFGEKSGIELDEVAPQISDTDSVRSAIGQGTNAYTNTQMARYVTAVANKGTVYNLTLLEKLVAPNGELETDYEAEVLNQLDYSRDTWKHIHNGMHDMAFNCSQLDVVNWADIKSAGKTGTAEVSSLHADNVMYVGFAPLDSPEIAFSIRITNGYTSAYTAEVGCALLEYYFDVLDIDTIQRQMSYNVSEASAGD